MNEGVLKKLQYLASGELHFCIVWPFYTLFGHNLSYKDNNSQTCFFYRADGTVFWFCWIRSRTFLSVIVGTINKGVDAAIEDGGEVEDVLENRGNLEQKDIMQSLKVL